MCSDTDFLDTLFALDFAWPRTLECITPLPEGKNQAGSLVFLPLLPSLLVIFLSLKFAKLFDTSIDQAPTMTSPKKDGFKHNYGPRINSVKIDISTDKLQGEHELRHGMLRHTNPQRNTH